MAASLEQSNSPSSKYKPASVLEATVIGIFGFVFGTVLSIAVLLLLGVAGVGLTITSVIIVSLVFTQGIGFGAVALLYVQYRDAVVTSLQSKVGHRWWLAQSSLSIPVSVPSVRDLLLIGGGYIGTFIALIVASLALAATGVERGQQQITEIGIANPELILLLIPLSILLVGPGEELLYRGVVQGRMRESFGAVGAILLASAIFAGIHYFGVDGDAVARLATVAVLFVPSIVFGVLYELSENIVVPSLVHGLFNATQFAGLYAITQLDEIPDAAMLLFYFA
ncbi:CPBP family intramembrane glutamic endopeptidase [Natronocalculus amylovorans]|uniref:CPBP family intramembrane metalloprotease n=1 Tax=Natronocalculus amylovorans TaxID=2917812 RepID=A0AAE3FVT4_9EURY|nr:type II CAAX endopeptidase family protein [Natronocalculus amylovorans]MCL9816502.1 CPBP family intramembrane metalloprotease [Natronocalculus amylovorans]NUE00948.1 CPBP family intramembrane metalloprotease [Halorubraceae archaeon YAN]